MMNIPVNRWTVAAALAVAAWVGGDLWSAVLQAVAALVIPHVPAV